ncbi:hypothetical protein BD311DRAFT_33656 [Dichomitus squalens]|uniref:Uncharacterized protein n=1 Tax=Dichomitus squalens TaxID=114155 RepID=A0A4Q9MXK1_9APHY|nr:hypothetical protein BD311DRAFT_33656 [Dichomitus squalens]
MRAGVADRDGGRRGEKRAPKSRLNDLAGSCPLWKCRRLTRPGAHQVVACCGPLLCRHSYLLLCARFPRISTSQENRLYGRTGTATLLLLTCGSRVATSRTSPWSVKNRSAQYSTQSQD